MAAAGALDQNVSTAANLSALLTRLIGSGAETTTGGTTTKQTMVNPQDIMTQLLEASGRVGFNTTGLAKTIAQGKSAGVYGKSAQLNVNDLLSRVATEASIAAAPTVQTNPTTVRKQAGMMSGAGAGLGMLALLAGSKSGRKKISDMYDEYFGKDAFGGTDMGDIPKELQGISPSDFNFDTPITAGSIDAVNAVTPAAVDAFSTDVSTVDGGSNDMMTAAAFGAGGFGALEGTVESANAAGAAGGDAIGTLLGANSANWGIDVASDVGWTSGADLVTAADYASTAGDVASGGIPYLSTAINVAEGDWTGAALTAAGTAIGGPIGGVIGNLVSNVIGDGCFITTAILKALGNNNDQAKELQILRKYRDSWLLANHPEDIQEYYRIAPQVVEAIESRDDSFQIWRHLWRAYLEDAISLVVQGKNEIAYHTYKEMVEAAKQFVSEKEMA